MKQKAEPPPEWHPGEGKLREALGFGDIRKIY